MPYHRTPDPPAQIHTYESKRRKARREATYEVDPETGGVLIPLAGKPTCLTAIVDPEDVPRVIEYSWTAKRTATRGDRPLFYVRGKVDSKSTYLHRLVLGITDRTVKVDHINHDTLDCRKSNLRAGTHQQNIFNRRPNLYGTSPYKGVHWFKRTQKWRAAIKINGQRAWIKEFADEVEAAMAYDEKARELFGEHAYLNFPDLMEREAA